MIIEIGILKQCVGKLNPERLVFLNGQGAKGIGRRVNDNGRIVGVVNSNGKGDRRFKAGLIPGRENQAVGANSTIVGMGMDGSGLGVNLNPIRRFNCDLF